MEALRMVYFIYRINHGWANNLARVPPGSNARLAGARDKKQVWHPHVRISEVFRNNDI